MYALWTTFQRKRLYLRPDGTGTRDVTEAKHYATRAAAEPAARQESEWNRFYLDGFHVAPVPERGATANGRRRKASRNKSPALRSRKAAVPTLVTFDVEKEGASTWSIKGQGFDAHGSLTKSYRFSTFASKGAAVEQAEKAAARAVSGASAPYDRATVFVQGAAYRGYSHGRQRGTSPSVMFEVGREFLAGGRRGAWTTNVIVQDEHEVEVDWRQLPGRSTRDAAVSLAKIELARLAEKYPYIEAVMFVENEPDVTLRHGGRISSPNGRARRLAPKRRR